MAKSITIKIGATNTASAVMGKVAASATKLSNVTQNIGRSFTRAGFAVSAAAGAILTPLIAATASFGTAGDEIDKMSKRTGVAARGLSELAFATEQSGASLPDLEKGIKGMQRALFDADRGSKEIVDSLAEVGLTAADLKGKLPEEQFTILAGRIGAIKDPSLKAALSMKIFGRAGAQLLPLMNEGVGGIRALREEAVLLGRSMSGEEAASAAAYTDAMNRVKSVLIGVKNQVGAALAPLFTQLANRIAGSLTSIAGFIANNKQLVVTLAAVGVGLAALGTTLVTIGALVTAAGIAMGGLVSAISAVGAVAAAVFSPIGAIVAAVTVVVVGLGAAFLTVAVKAGILTDAFKFAKAMLASFLDVAKTTFAGVSAAIKTQDWGTAAAIAWAGVKVAFWRGLQQLTIAVASFLPKLWIQFKTFFFKLVAVAIDTGQLMLEALTNPGKAGAMFAAKISQGMGALGNVSGPAEWMHNQRVKAEAELAALSKSAVAKAAIQTATAAAAPIVTPTVDPKALMSSMVAAAGKAEASVNSMASGMMQSAFGFAMDKVKGISGKIAAMHKAGALDDVGPKVATDKQDVQSAPQSSPLTATVSRLMTRGPAASIQDKILTTNKEQLREQKQATKATQENTAAVEKQAQEKFSLEFIG